MVSRDTSKSPSPESGDARVHHAQPSSDIQPSVAESLSPAVSTNAAPNSVIISIDDFDERVDREEKEREKKKEAKGRRKDTATSFTSFIHRFTRFDKDDRNKVTFEEERQIDRPDKLTLPDHGGDTWFDMKTMPTDQFRTALDMGNERGMPIYEWKPNSLEEKLLTDFSNGQDLIRMEPEDQYFDTMEKSLSIMLDEFRGGSMKSFSPSQLSALRLAKSSHEEITNLHLALDALDADNATNESEGDKICDQLCDRLFSLHANLNIE